MSRTGLEPGLARPMSMRKLSEFTASEGSCKTNGSDDDCQHRKQGKTGNFCCELRMRSKIIFPLNKEKQHFKDSFHKENNFVRLTGVGSSRLTVFSAISMIKLIFLGFLETAHITVTTRAKEHADCLQL